MFLSFVQPHPASDTPDLIPPAAMMRREGVADLEAWFADGREWAVLLRVLGGLSSSSWVLEIGAGVGQVASAIRDTLGEGSAYDGLESSRENFRYLDEVVSPALPWCRFKLADMKSPENRDGATPPDKYVYPYPSRTFDLVFSTRTFARFAPEHTAQAFREMARMLKPGARAILGVHLLDNFDRARPRPRGFDGPAYDFTKPYRSYGDQYVLGHRTRTGQLSAYRLTLLEKLAANAGLVLPQPPLVGRWSGAKAFTTERDILILEKPKL